MTAVEQIDVAIAALQQARALLQPVRITDRIGRPKPALPTLGPAGTSFTDLTFGSHITRLTDATQGVSWRVPSNAHLAAWNADGTACYALGGGGQVRVMRSDGSLLGEPYSQAEPCFSRTDPDLLFTNGGPHARTIRTYRLSTGAVTDVLEVDTIVEGLGDTYLGGFLHAAGALVVFFGGTSADRHRYVVRWTPNTIRSLDTLPLGYTLHSVALDLSGRYLLLAPANAKPYQTVVWDTQANTLTPITKDMLASGHDALGYGQMVNMDDGSAPWDAAEWQIRSLSDPSHPRDLLRVELTPMEMGLVDHSSWNNDTATTDEPFISSTYRTEHDTPWRAWDDEIVRVATDGSGVVERLAHHRSVYTPGDFWSQPIANIDPTGTKVTFTSNMERSLGVDAQGNVRQDVFLLEWEATK